MLPKQSGSTAVLAVLLISTALACFSCGGGNKTGSGSVSEVGTSEITVEDVTARYVDKGGFQLRMHDRPIAMRGIEIEKVLVGIEKVMINKEGEGWITLSDTTTIYDLLRLQDGTTAILLEKPLEPGRYNQIRIILSENNEVVVRGRPYRLKVPSGEQTGVKLVTSFDIVKGKKVEVTLDFDAEKSIHWTKGQGFIMHPTIEIESVAEYDGAAIITPSGGNVSTIDGSVNAYIPAGALSGDVIMTISTVEQSELPLLNAPDLAIVGNGYIFGPEGTVFDSPVTLTFHYNETEVATLGMEDNLQLYYFDPALSQWVQVPAVVHPYSNEIKTTTNHFSLYAVAVAAKCDDGIANGSEEAIDCGGTCPSQCVDCTGYNFGNASSSHLYSFSDPVVANTAQEALAEYATYKGVDVSTLDSPDEYMEAVAYYVAKYMMWMEDEGDWDGPQTTSRIITDSVNRYGQFVSDTEKKDPDYVGIKTGYCYEAETKFYKKVPKFCGDCEDHAILRAALLRTLGVNEKCIINADYNPWVCHPTKDDNCTPWAGPSDVASNKDIPSTPPEPYDYDTAEDLFEEGPGADDEKKTGHTFNVIIYKNKYRIMDYYWLGHFFSSTNEWSQEYHRMNNVWSDHFGQLWDPPFTPPPDKIHNYPGAEKCYESGINYWTHATLYKDICP